MKQLFFICYGFAVLEFATRLLWADEQSALIGKWSAQKTNAEGQHYTQILGIKKDRFTFEIRDSAGHTAIYAEGDLKLESYSPFHIARFIHIRAGASPTNLEDVDDDRAVVYTVDSDTLTIASNFDKEREQKPDTDVYHRINETATTGTLVIDEIQFTETPQSSTWFVCFEAKVGDISKRFHIEDKGYDKNMVTIPIGLEIPGTKAGQKCNFKLQLDDVDGDACNEDADNKTAADFTIDAKGAQLFKPEDNWKFTIRWHLK